MCTLVVYVSSQCAHLCDEEKLVVLFLAPLSLTFAHARLSTSSFKVGRYSGCPKVALAPAILLGFLTSAWNPISDSIA